MTPVELAEDLRTRTAAPAAPAKRAAVTVAIPVRNEEGILAECLESVLDQDYPPEAIEVLLVDGGATPATRAVASAAAARDPRVRILENPAGLASTALNVALVEA
jgi:glycosyltransferase involved in cell wall biosynthesis